MVLLSFECIVAESASTICGDSSVSGVYSMLSVGVGVAAVLQSEGGRCEEGKVNSMLLPPNPTLKWHQD